jgi:hypothetical protein
MNNIKKDLCDICADLLTLHKFGYEFINFAPEGVLLIKKDDKKLCIPREYINEIGKSTSVSKFYGIFKSSNNIPPFLDRSNQFHSLSLSCVMFIIFIVDLHVTNIKTEASKPPIYLSELIMHMTGGDILLPLLNCRELHTTFNYNIFDYSYYFMYICLVLIHELFVQPARNIYEKHPVLASISDATASALNPAVTAPERNINFNFGLLIKNIIAQPCIDTLTNLFTAVNNWCKKTALNKIGKFTLAEETKLKPVELEGKPVESVSTNIVKTKRHRQEDSDENSPEKHTKKKKK